MLQRLLPLALLLALPAHGVDQQSRGIDPRSAEPYASTPPGVFRCLSGKHTIPFTQLNDDYCDCPDGSDEPGTSACSAVPTAPGFFCLNEGHAGIWIKSSRVGDFVCDCCDGSDELETGAGCANTCAADAVAAAAAAKAGAAELQAGLQKKAEMVGAAAKHVGDKLGQLTSKAREKKSLEIRIATLVEQKRRMELAEKEEGEQAAKKKDLQIASSLGLDTLSAEALRTLVVGVLRDGSTAVVNHTNALRAAAGQRPLDPTMAPVQRAAASAATGIGTQLLAACDATEKAAAEAAKSAQQGAADCEQARASAASALRDVSSAAASARAGEDASKGLQDAETMMSDAIEKAAQGLKAVRQHAVCAFAPSGSLL